MKKSLNFIFIALCIFTAIHLQAQNCQPNPIYADSLFGVYPLPDPLGSSTSSLYPGCVNSYYEQLFTVAVPDSILLEFNGIPLDLELYSVLVDSIKGLPPYINYICQPPSCFFEQSTIGCVLFSGVPKEAGIYEPIIYAQLVTYLGTELMIPISLPSQSDDIIEVFPGEYKIKICSSGTCFGDCMIISTEDAFADAVGLRQNIPNPFSNTTTITVDTKLSGTFDFKVFNLMGKMIYQEQVTLLTGENTITFDGTPLQTGMYLYSVGQGNDIVTNRMIINR